MSYELNEYRVQFTLVDHEACLYFDCFLDRDCGGTSRLRRLGLPIAVEIEARDVEPSLSEGGTIACASSSVAYHVWSRGASRLEVWSAARRLGRHLWLARLTEDSPVAFVHASAIDDGRTIVAFTGEKYAGKTTLLLDAVLANGRSLLTNDCLVLRRVGSSIVATCVPTYARIRAETANRFLPELRKVSSSDPVSKDEFARWWASHTDEDRNDQSLFLTHGAFGGRRLPMIDIRSRDVVLVDTWMASGQTIDLEDLGANADAAAALLRRNLKDELHRGHSSILGTPRSTQWDIEPLINAVATRARVIRFGHLGSVEPLLARLSAL